MAKRLWNKMSSSKVGEKKGLQLVPQSPGFVRYLVLLRMRSGRVSHGAFGKPLCLLREIHMRYTRETHVLCTFPKSDFTAQLQQ